MAAQQELALGLGVRAEHRHPEPAVPGGAAQHPAAARLEDQVAPNRTGSGDDDVGRLELVVGKV